MRPPRKILIIRFSSIGDIVLTTPVIRCLKQQLPEAEIHFCTKRQFASILEANPHLDKIHTLDGSLNELVGKLKQENFDFIVDLHRNIRTKIIKLRLGIPNGTFPKVNFQKWLLVNFKRNRLPNKHVVDRYFEATRKLGIENDHKGLDYIIPSKDIVPVGKMPEPHVNGYVAIVLAATYVTKQFPAEKVISLCRELDYPVALLGGPGEQALSARIAAACGSMVWNACGAFNINQSASLVKHARAVITNDTGLMHIAAAFQKPIFTTWGNTVPDFGMYPYFGDGKGKEYRYELNDLPCRPCSKLGHDQCPKGHFLCMLGIDEVNMAEKVNSILK